MTAKLPKIGILGLQGAFQKHLEMFKRIGADAEIVVYPEQLRHIDGLVIPGGESTTMTKVIDDMRLRVELDTFRGPMFGTCAGAIMLSNDPRDARIRPLNRMQVTLDRNGFGRQVDSFIQDVELGIDPTPFRGIFIRAPRIVGIFNGIEILGKIEDEVVFVRNSNNLLTTFHPELSDDARIHEYFINRFF